MSAASPLDPNTVPMTPRPTVLSLAIKEKAALYAAYMPFLKNGGMFVPTQKPYKLGDEIYLILALMDDPNKYPIAGKVAWITPPGAHHNKAQGIGVISRTTRAASAPACALKKSSAPRCAHRAPLTL
jgi:type IV pilus assembly protein PilZ